MTAVVSIKILTFILQILNSCIYTTKAYICIYVTSMCIHMEVIYRMKISKISELKYIKEVSAMEFGNYRAELKKIQNYNFF